MTHVTQMLRSQDMREFNAALAELQSGPRDEAVSLLEGLASEGVAEFRARAIEVMQKIYPEHAHDLAIRLIHDPEGSVRVNAVYSLWQLRSHDAAPLIARLLSTDPDKLVRSWAALALGDLGDPSLLSSLMTAAEQDNGVDHEGRPIRETALASIKMIQSRYPDSHFPGFDNADNS
jgi:HEAT repeat protein